LRPSGELDARVTRAVLMVSAALLVLMSGGCDDNAQEVKTVTVETTVTVEQPSAQRRQRQKPRPRATTNETRSDRFVNCDQNFEAKTETTTCPFAQNVFWTYWTSAESSGPYSVWSPAAQASFAVTCKRRGVQVVCITSDDAAVRFPQAAVDVYSESQADAYASSHDLGPDSYEDLPNTGPPPDDVPHTGGSEDCQGYDPCIPPGGDVDCAGGSGNGPRYVDGPVYVDGFDPYGLDGDGNGVGCQ
jgi:hypothetical protein